MSNGPLAGGLAGLRKQVSDRIGRLIDWRINNPLEGNRLFEAYRLVDLVPEHERARRDFGRRLADMERRFGEVERIQRWSHNELERVIPQIAAQESQLEALREKLAAVPAADRTQIDESRSLIDEIRREHSQIRVRLTAVAQYEDRLRKLEDRNE
jgi:septal ring factor EnvC (AmiA/AmiB activator)